MEKLSSGIGHLKKEESRNLLEWLLFATSIGNLDTVKYLVDRQKKLLRDHPDSKDFKDVLSEVQSLLAQTLWSAAKVGSLDIVEFLIEEARKSCARGINQIKYK